MKTTFSLLLALLVGSPIAAVGDDPQSAAITTQYYEMDHLIKAFEAADAIPVEGNAEAAKKKYQTRDHLAEVLVSNYGKMVALLEEKPDRDWTERMLLHYLNHHMGSGSEALSVIVSSLCLNDAETTAKLFPTLTRKQRDRIIHLLQSPHSNYHDADGCKRLAEKLVAAQE